MNEQGHIEDFGVSPKFHKRREREVLVRFDLHAMFQILKHRYYNYI